MKKFLKRVLYLVKPYIFHEIIGLILTILYALAVFSSPIVSKYLIDEVIPTNSLNKLYIGLSIFFIVCAGQPIFGYFKDMLFMNVTEKITFDIRKKMYSKVINAPMKFFDETKNGEIVSRVINDGRAGGEFITSFFVIFIKNILLIIMIVVGMFYLSPRITSIVMLIFSIFFVVNWQLSKKFNKLSLNVQRNFDSMCVTINQSVDSILTIKSFIGEKSFQKRYHNVLLKTYEDLRKMKSLNILLGSLANLIVVFSVSLIYGIGTLYVMKGEMTLGTVIALGLYFQLLVQPVYELLNNNIEIQTIMPIFDRIYEYLELEQEHLLDQSFKKVEGNIHIKNLYFSYKHEQEDSLRDINITLPDKGLVAFVGPSGAGKSTLAKLLMGLYQPTKGNIFIGEKDINEIDVNVLRSNIGFVSQDIDLFNLSIKDNIRCGNSSITDKEIMEACKMLQLHEKICELPGGYESIITERINLSGGEKQRIAIARVLMKKPKIYILDEPTSALDPENENIITNFIEKTSKNNLVIVISHKLSTVKNSSVIYVFEKGRIVEYGNHEELLEMDGNYSRGLFNIKDEIKFGELTYREYY